MSPSPPLYQRLADEIADAIGAGVLRPGDRLPSVRETRRTRDVSPSTVFQAYGLLETLGLVDARPRSGYYVRVPARPSRDTPSAAPTRAGAAAVTISEGAFGLLEAASDPRWVPLGSAFPSTQLFPLAALARSAARTVRRMRPEEVTGALLAGDAGLRQSLRRRYALHGVPLADDELLITNGAMEALNLCLQATTQPGDVVVVESPTFYTALQSLERLHLHAAEVTTDPQTGVDLDALARLLKRRRVAACWFMTTFQNPLGALLPASRKRALVALLAQHGVPLIEDDVYAELHAGSRRPLPAKAYDDAGLVLHCSSFSKCLAPGYRIGWAAAGRYTKAVQRLKMMTSLATSLPPQLALDDYLSRGSFDRHLRGLRLALASGQQQGQRLVERYFPAGTRWTRPEGGYFLWVELPARVDAVELHRRALAASISTAPGLLFSADGRFTHHVRLNLGHFDDPRVEGALRRLGEIACELAAARAPRAPSRATPTSTARRKRSVR